jgi:hypothetical protein
VAAARRCITVRQAQTVLPVAREGAEPLEERGDEPPDVQVDRRTAHVPEPERVARGEHPEAGERLLDAANQVPERIPEPLQRRPPREDPDHPDLPVRPLGGGAPAGEQLGHPHDLALLVEVAANLQRREEPPGDGEGDPGALREVGAGARRVARCREQLLRKAAGKHHLEEPLVQIREEIARRPVHGLARMTNRLAAGRFEPRCVKADEPAFIDVAERLAWRDLRDVALE